MTAGTLKGGEQQMRTMAREHYGSTALDRVFTVRAAPPISFSDTPARVAPPCVRGEHNHAILGELGYSPEDVAKVEADGVLCPQAEPEVFTCSS